MNALVGPTQMIQVDAPYVKNVQAVLLQMNLVVSLTLSALKKLTSGL